MNALRSDDLFGALVARYTQTFRTPEYERARDRLTRMALVPSKIFDDSATWTTKPSPVLRMLLVQGGLEGGRYVLAARPTVVRPARPGDSRHVITLAKLTPNEYVWDTAVDFSLGAVTAADVGNLFAALLTAAEGRAERELRADYRLAAPRAAAALGLLFSVDSLRATPFGDGTTDVQLTIGLHADQLKNRFPAFSAYLARYLNPARYRLSVNDRSGATWFDVRGGDQQLGVHYRASRGRLVPLYGLPRPRPDTLELRAEVTTRMKIFHVGMRNLVSEFIVTDTPHERAWTIISRREPDWDLPLIGEHLLRTPLRRPFDGTGVIFHLGVRDSAGAATLLERRSHTVVQESAILRFLNSLGSRALSDLADRTEREEEQFLREVFVALQGDARALTMTDDSADSVAQKTSAADHEGRGAVSQAADHKGRGAVWINSGR